METIWASGNLLGNLHEPLSGWWASIYLCLAFQGSATVHIAIELAILLVYNVQSMPLCLVTHRLATTTVGVVSPSRVAETIGGGCCLSCATRPRDVIQEGNIALCLMHKCSRNQRADV